LFLQSDEDLLLWLLERNAQLAKKTDEEWLVITNSNAVKKARANNFFLGMDRTWLETNSNFED
jgi:hypothetical protein